MSKVVNSGNKAIKEKVEHLSQLGGYGNRPEVTICECGEKILHLTIDDIIKCDKCGKVYTIDDSSTEEGGR